MSVMVQIRNMPDDLHRKLKSRAALSGMSLSDYLMAEIRQIAARPTMEEMRERLLKLPPVDLPESPADIIRAERDSR
jgi:plasmid stability protein